MQDGFDYCDKSNLKTPMRPSLKLLPQCFIWPIPDRSLSRYSTKHYNINMTMIKAKENTDSLKVWTFNFAPLGWSWTFEVQLRNEGRVSMTTSFITINTWISVQYIISVYKTFAYTQIKYIYIYVFLEILAFMWQHFNLCKNVQEIFLNSAISTTMEQKQKVLPFLLMSKEPQTKQFGKRDHILHIASW